MALKLESAELKLEMQRKKNEDMKLRIKTLDNRV